jgi:hypothetical protein
VLHVDVKRMIVEAGVEIQALGTELGGYLGVIGVSPSSYGHWMRESLAGRLKEAPPREPTAAELEFRAVVKERIKDLVHRRHYTHGLNAIWAQIKGGLLSREEFRDLAREAHREASAEKRKGWLRYEFTNPDVAHSLDLTELPRDTALGVRRYMARILDDCTRCTIWKGTTRSKGLYVGMAALQSHLQKGQAPLVFKFDLEFGHPAMENLLLQHRIAPLPNPPSYPPFNGKQERANKDVQGWLQSFGPAQDWSDKELQQELNFCFEELDGLWERQEFGGGTRRQAYASMPRAVVDREVFFADVQAGRRALLSQPGNRLAPMQAWRIATKESLKKFGLVRYRGPQEV